MGHVKYSSVRSRARPVGHVKQSVVAREGWIVLGLGESKTSGREGRLHDKWLNR